MKTITLTSTILAVVALALNASAVAPAAGKISGKEAFARMKGLAGEWRGTAGKAGAGAGAEATVTYRVTSAGSAVLETLFPGTDHEMVTVYYLDGGKLALTHYCAMANQPRMLLSRKSTPNELDFDFAGGANINPRKDAHMHSVRLRLVSANAISGEWQGFKGGKPSEVMKFSLTRTP